MKANHRLVRSKIILVKNFHPASLPTSQSLDVIEFRNPIQINHSLLDARPVFAMEIDT